MRGRDGPKKNRGGEGRAELSQTLFWEGGDRELTFAFHCRSKSTFQFTSQTFLPSSGTAGMYASVRGLSGGSARRRRLAPVLKRKHPDGDTGQHVSL